jgi:hypothetical protein
MKTFEFYYSCLGDDYTVTVKAENLNKALIWFAKYYHQITEIYTIKEIK